MKRGFGFRAGTLFLLNVKCVMLCNVKCVMLNV